MIDATAVRFLFFTLAAWLHERDADAIACLLEENRTLRAHTEADPSDDFIRTNSHKQFLPPITPAGELVKWC